MTAAQRRVRRFRHDTEGRRSSGPNTTDDRVGVAPKIPRLSGKGDHLPSAVSTGSFAVSHRDQTGAPDLLRGQPDFPAEFLNSGVAAKAGQFGALKYSAHPHGSNS